MNSEQKNSIGSYISKFYRLGSIYLTKEYEKFGIGFGQYQFLIQLYLKDGLSHEELTERVCVDKANTTRAIKKLEELGYVNTVVNPKDKRKYNINLTQKAIDQRIEILKIAATWEAKLLNSLTEEETSSLNEIFSKMLINVKE